MLFLIKCFEILLKIPLISLPFHSFTISPSDMQEVRSTIRGPSIPVASPITNGFHPHARMNDDPPMSQELRAAQVHGQIHSDELVRKPTRLDALPAVAPSGKKSRKKKGNYDQY